MIIYFPESRLALRQEQGGAQQCVYKIVAGRWSIQLKITILLLWLIETEVFQMPQLHKPFNVGRNVKKPK
jgi:hypothetical protein